MESPETPETSLDLVPIEPAPSQTPNLINPSISPFSESYTVLAPLPTVPLSPVSSVDDILANEPSVDLLIPISPDLTPPNPTSPTDLPQAPLDVNAGTFESNLGFPNPRLSGHPPVEEPSPEEELAVPDSLIDDISPSVTPPPIVTELESPEIYIPQPPESPVDEASASSPSSNAPIPDDSLNAVPPLTNPSVKSPSEDVTSVKSESGDPTLNLIPLEVGLDASNPQIVSIDDPNPDLFPSNVPLVGGLQTKSLEISEMEIPNTLDSPTDKPFTDIPLIVPVPEEVPPKVDPLLNNPSLESLSVDGMSEPDDPEPDVVPPSDSSNPPDSSKDYLLPSPSPRRPVDLPPSKMDPDVSKSLKPPDPLIDEFSLSNTLPDISKPSLPENPQVKVPFTQDSISKMPDKPDIPPKVEPVSVKSPSVDCTSGKSMLTQTLHI